MLMSALSSKARAVVEEARAEMRPPAGERERLEALLDAHLGATPADAPSPAHHAPALPPHAGAWRLVTSLTVGVALVGGVAFLALRPNVSQNSTPAPVSVPAQTPRSAPAIAGQTAAPAVEPHAAPLPEPLPAKAPAEPAPAQRSQDRLAQEVALLSRATSDLRAGRAGAALKSLDEHQRKFPNGMLTVERRAVRAQALCTLKRVSEGRAELSLLAPQSPAAGRAKQLCDAASPAGRQ
jgi:hypothetical protein